MLQIAKLISLVIWLLTWLIIGKLVFDKVYYKKISLEMELLSNNNMALGFSFSGFIIALSIALVSGVDPLLPIYINGITGTLLIVAILIFTRIFDWVFMKKIDLPSEIIDKQNIASGIIEGSFFMSMGIIVSGSLVGGDIASWSSMYIEIFIYSLIGMILFFFSAKVMALILGLNLEQELLNDNRAVAACFAGLFIGVAIVIRDAIAGPVYKSFLTDLGITFIDWFISIIVMTILFYIFDLLLFRKFSFKEELKEPNLGAGIVIGSLYVVSSFISHILVG